MTVLFDGFGGYFDNGVFTVGVNRLAEEVLDEQASRHGHFVFVGCRVFTDLEAQGPGECRFVTGFFEDRVYKFDGGGFAFGARDRDHLEVASREAVYNGAQKSQCVVVTRLESGKYFIGDDFFK